MRTVSKFLSLLLLAAGLVHAQSAPSVTGVVNNATPNAGNAPIAPGELVAVNGANLGDETPLGCGSPTGIPNSCGGVSVTIGGKTAPVRNESAGRLILQVPVDLTGASASVVVTRVTGGQTLVSQPFTATVAPTAPQMYFASVNNVSYGNCFSAGNPVSAANAVRPGDLVRCLGTGFGVTNPVVPSGQVQPQSPLPVVVAPVRVTVANQDAIVNSVTLAAGNIVGQDQVIFTVPQGVFPGNQPVVVTVGGVAAFPLPLPIATTVITGGPVNAASYARAGLPNAGIAQGSMFVLFGFGLGPQVQANAASFPLPKNLGGSSIRVTVGSATVDAIMLYALSFQVAALLPSNTPVGNGALTLTFNGTASNTVPIRVVPSSFGIFTRNQGGTGPGILFNFNSQTSQPVNSLVESAHPGQVMTLWGTGLSAVSGDEAGGPLPGNLSLPVEVYVGNKLVTPIYKGRSGCCSGIDQIVFTIPDGVAGCYVSVAVRAGGVLSNTATIAVTSSGSICSDPGGFSVTDLQKVQGGSTLNLADLTLGRIHPKLSLPGLGNLEGNLDLGDGVFRHYPSAADVLASYRGSVGSLLGLPSAGSCTVAAFPYQDFFDAILQFGGDVVGTTGLDAGAALNIAGPRGAKQLPRRQGGAPGQPSYSYRVNGDLIGGSVPGLPDSPSLPDYLDPGSYTEDNGPGGPQVGAFSASLTIPSSTVVWANQAALSNIPRSQDLTVTWTGGDAGGLVAVFGSAADPSVGAGAAFTCSARADAGTLTIPSWVLAALPASGVDPSNGLTVGGLSLGTTVPQPTRFTATGIDAGFFNWAFIQLKNVVFQ